EYLQTVPENKDPDLRFIYSQYCVRNFEWEKAISQLEILLSDDPSNIEYQLLRGQIGARTGRDLRLSEKYLLNVLTERPHEVAALISIITLYNLEGNKSEANKFLTLAWDMTPDASDNNKYAVTKEKIDDFKNADNIAEIVNDAEHFKIEGNCDESLMKFRQYLSAVTIPARTDYIKLGDLLSCSKDYTGAIDAYSKALEMGYDSGTAIKRIKNYYYNNDSSQAAQELEKFDSMGSQEADFKFLLAEGYLATFQMEKAETVYKALMEEENTDSVRFRICQNLILLGEHYISVGNYVKANSIYSEAADYSENPEIAAEIKIRQLQISDLLVHQGRYSEADKLMDQLYDNVNESDNELFRRQIILGDKLIEAKKNEEAEILYKKMYIRERDGYRLSELRQKRLFLGDAYALENKYGAADNVYNNLLVDTEDSVQINIIKERISWLPKNGFADGFASAGNMFYVFIPKSLNVLPFSEYYHDNRKFSQFNYGFKFDAGFTGLLSLGGIWKGTQLGNSVDRYNYKQYMITGKISFSKYLNLTGSFGIISGDGVLDGNTGDVALHYDHPDDVKLFISYENSDARFLLHSPDILKSGMNADHAKLGIMNNISNSFRLSVIYDYLRIADANKGNDLQIRFGKRFMTDGIFGYEYCFSDYSFNSALYNTPQNLNSHGLWSEWNWTFSEVKLKISGKIGYIAARDFTFGDIAGEVIYSPEDVITISGKIGFGNSYRYNSNYTSIYGYINASFGIF
ncbi:MAG: hypothetical protein WC061_10445, partial [Melioribacteraceae bacterium]